MSELIWINGTIMPLSEARIAVEDRGYQFADGVYEVIRIYNGKSFELDAHLRRLQRSAEGIRLTIPLDQSQLYRQIHDLIAQSGLVEGMIYLQLTRGTAKRSHAFPPCRPNLLFYTRQLPEITPVDDRQGVKLLPVDDERWKRCWVKSIALLPNVLAKDQAITQGFDEAVFVENGIVSECSSSNVFLVKDHTLITHPVGEHVLPGITREVILKLASSLDIAAVERPAYQEEFLSADEVFISSTTREISWVVQWAQRTIGSGRRGPVTLQLERALRESIQQKTA